MNNIRQTLEALIRQHGEDYASLSKLLGRNSAYIQQFIHRGVPRKLHEDDRRLLAEYFRVDEQILGGRADSVTAKYQPSRALILIDRLDVQASAGHGALADHEDFLGKIGFDATWLRRMQLPHNELSMIEVQGDSMIPTLHPGDDILVDQSDNHERLRDGIYVLRVDDSLLVKRLILNPITRVFTIRSDNPIYPDIVANDLSLINIIGRVVWVGRKVG